MLFDFSTISPAERYKLMVNTITPRPIAWVVTVDGEGRRNAAPFSFFNAMLARPPLVAIGIAPDLVRENVVEKDSLRAIRETEEFTVALVSEDDAAAMNITAADAPVDTDETEIAGIATKAAEHITPPLIASAPVNLECRLFQLIEPGPNTAIVLGEIIAMHIDEKYIYEEKGKLRINTPAMRLIARQHGPGGYIRTQDGFEIRRKSWPIEK